MPMLDGTLLFPLEFGSRCLGSDEVVRNHMENPRRKEHRDVTEVGNVNLPLVAREYAGNDQVVGAGDQRDKPYARNPRTRAMQTRKETRVGPEFATNT